jgi:hypothetical protein
MLVAASRPRNAAAWLSLACAALWPACLIAIVVATGLSPDHSVPALLEFFASLGLDLAPFAAIVLGVVGLYGALKRRVPRGTAWPAAIGLALGLLWVVGIFLISDLGAALVNWLTHLRY